MKTQLIRGIGVALLAATCMFAQEPRRAAVRIPFGFHFGSLMLPAGDYEVAAEDRTGLVHLRSSDCKTNVAVLSDPLAPRKNLDQGKLIFNRYGNEYFLSKIWTSRGENGREMPMSKREMKSAANQRDGIETIMARQ